MRRMTQTGRSVGRESRGLGPGSVGVAPAASVPAWRRRLPNQLTCARLGLAVVFFVLLAGAGPGRGWGPPLLAAAVFSLAALTDALDGWLARRWGVISRFGRVMDPFADKVLVLGAFVMLAGPDFRGPTGQVSGVQPWMVVVILSRELLVTTLRGLVEARGVNFGASLSGKLKMIVQSVATPVILLLIAAHEADAARAPTLAVNTWIAWVVVAVTAWSALPYVARAARALRDADSGGGAS